MWVIGPLGKIRELADFYGSSSPQQTGFIMKNNTHPATLDVDRLMADCQTRRLRRGGPGGQHRNKVETAVVITHQPSGVTGEANERRSQEQNRQMAVQRLRINLALSVRLDRNEDYRPSQLWQKRCRGERITVSPAHEDFPALLSEVLDVLHANHYELPASAVLLGITASQITKFLKLQPQAMVLVNQERQQRDLHPLR